jgi:hypothetical protein
MRKMFFPLGLIAVVLMLDLPIHGDEKKDAGGVVVDKAKRTVTIDAKVAPRKLADEKYGGKIYPIEVVACWGYPKGQKAHETLVTIDIKPSEVHKALQSLGLKPGTPVMGQSKVKPQGPEVKVFLEVPGAAGGMRRVPIERTLVDNKSNKPMPKLSWRFTGSIQTKPDPDKEATIYGADATGTLIAIFPVTDQTVLQTNLAFKDQEFLRLEANKEIVPKEGTAVKLVLEVP